MKLLDASDFGQCMNQVFDVDIGGAGVPMTLVDVRKLKTPPHPNLLREPFALMFRSEQQILFPQQIYPMRHFSLGALSIFIVPVGRDSDGILYEAVFN
jgi:hypothetical protein